MRSQVIRHEHLKRAMDEIDRMGEDVSEESFQRFLNELKHSYLISAARIAEDEFNLMVAHTIQGDFGLLFTDMDEFRKVFSGFDVESHELPFIHYKDLASKSDLEGYIINPASEFMPLTKDLLNMVEDKVPDEFQLPVHIAVMS